MGCTFGGRCCSRWTIGKEDDVDEVVGVLMCDDDDDASIWSSFVEALIDEGG
jgi:hypothetical protein